MDARVIEPRMKLAVLACMDAQVDAASLLGLRPGDAHVIRNAGGRATHDAMNAMALARRPEPHGQREIEVGSARGRALEPDAPPCISTIWRAIGKPRPVPPLLL